MQTAIGVLILLVSVWMMFVNLVPLIQQIRLDRAISAENIQEESLDHASTAVREHFISMLLMAAGTALVGAYFVLADNLTLINMLSSAVAWHGYGSIIQYFSKFDTAAQVAQRGGDALEYRKTRRFSLVLGLTLVAVGGYFALRGVLFGA